MTLKQFGYLAGGAILAYICYKLPLPLFLNWPLAIIFGLGGFGFAFLPIEERPMDVWVMSFFKSIYSPTQYVWSKTAVQTTTATAVSPAATTSSQPTSLTSPVPPASRKGDILSSIFAPPQNTQNQNKSWNPIDRLVDKLMPLPQHQPAPVAMPATIHANMDFAPPPSVKTREEAAAQHDEPKKEPATDTQQQIADLKRQRDEMEEELARLRLQSSPPPPVKPQNTYIATPVSRQGPSVRVITPDRAVKAGLPRLTTFTNVVTGIVKDGDQNLLPGVLVTVKDKDGVPVRALKTNRLGQFAASTQLANGTYLIEIEDPRMRFVFDRAQITLNGSIVPALEIFAKSQKEITRAKLEKELFGDKTQ